MISVVVVIVGVMIITAIVTSIPRRLTALVRIAAGGVVAVTVIVVVIGVGVGGQSSATTIWTRTRTTATRKSITM